MGHEGLSVGPYGGHPVVDVGLQCRTGADTGSGADIQGCGRGAEGAGR